MSMHDLDLLSNYDVAKDGEEGEQARKCRGAVDDQKRDMVDLQAICEISDASPSLVGMGYDNNLMPSVDELGGELVDVALDSAELREEEVADHGNIVGHLDWRC